MPLNVEIVSPDRTWWSGEAVSVGAPAADGDLGILTGHQPVLAVLRPGVVRVRPTSGEPVTMDVDGGFISVDQDSVTIVVDPTTGEDRTSGEN
ncbi:F0F1 ATP synthase subunit epsilon [Occultella glacieicola]|uniref:ATP synthase epsilon chain n=1 Tax=Occultella glacieicola TaxID=2518684 RepID=A0ABY2E603_9MICO|nr:F0F1 ATP synthase subunit epsilon [Occultella glacieicola]TDE96023.1 F0F1 ATP synthase subunit epsilon [Occultella glacieicola]